MFKRSNHPGCKLADNQHTMNLTGWKYSKYINDETDAIEAIENDTYVVCYPIDAYFIV